MTWEVDWSHPLSTGNQAWARNPDSYWASAREWHLVSTGRLRESGINTPKYRKDSWEVDWTKRKSKLVWARNPHSKMPSAREWHWIDHTTLDRAGIPWKRFSKHDGRYINASGYVSLTRRGMTDEEIALAEKHNLFKGRRKTMVWEHQLVAVKKYGSLLPERVVRHRNGIKTDNDPDNLLLGTTQENTMDHNTARLMAMYWREQYENAQKEIQRLTAMVEDGRALDTIEQALMTMKIQ